ncbi:MAG TPA: tetratricopeptide repeat protein [Planctomycetota bacterium]|nr:tetratricopeptide repeat protein [Planctomycetota bacterium]
MKPTYIICAVCLLIISAVALIGDEDIARAMVKKGDEALQKSDFTKAVELYKKALKEYPNLPEAYFGLGNTYAKSGDKRQARRNLEECIRLLKSLSKPTSAQQSFQKEAINRLNNLDKGRLELLALEKKYIEQSLALTKRLVKKDIPLTEEILNSIAIIDPANVEAAKLRQELKQSRFLAAWQPLFNGQNLDGWKPQWVANWKVDAGILVCDTPESEVNFRSEPVLGDSYKLLMEFKIDAFYKDSGGIGVILGNKNNPDRSITVLIIKKEGITLAEFKPGGPLDLKFENLPAGLELSDYNKLGLEIAKNSLKCRLNDRLVMEYQAERADLFRGGTGIWMQRSKIMVRKMQYLNE